MLIDTPIHLTFAACQGCPSEIKCEHASREARSEKERRGEERRTRNRVEEGNERERQYA
jgi:hypothetical protein